MCMRARHDWFYFLIRCHWVSFLEPITKRGDAKLKQIIFDTRLKTTLTVTHS